MIRYVLFCLVFVQTLYAQPSLTLTKRQMFEDFDSLVNTIVNTSPQIQIKKDLLKYDFIKITNPLRKQIDTISNDLSFYTVLLGVLNSSQDLHTSALNEQEGWAEIQDNKYWSRRNSNFKFTMPYTYGNGSYIVTSPFLLGNDTISIGTKLLKFNNQDINDYVNKHTWARNGFSYNFSVQTFYNDNFHKNLETIFKDSLALLFISPKGQTKNYILPSIYSTKYFPIKKYTDTTRVEYWEGEKILYIRLTEMNVKFKTYLKLKIAEVKTSGNEIKKIIIDIRNNGGGNDNVWMDLYADLISSPVSYSLKMVVTEQTSIRSEYKAIRKINKDKLLKKYGFYTVANEHQILEPSTTSLAFKGRIYVLSENVYSSAGSAVSVASANKNDNLVSVGRNTGQFLGIGTAPLHFQLKNTKFKYRIAPSMEITNAKSLNDLMQDKIEIIVPFDLNYYSAKFESGLLPTDKSFLISYDPFIKTVLKD